MAGVLLKVQGSVKFGGNCRPHGEADINTMKISMVQQLAMVTFCSEKTSFLKFFYSSPRTAAKTVTFC